MAWFSRLGKLEGQLALLCSMATGFTLHQTHGITDLHLSASDSLQAKANCSLFSYDLLAENGFYFFKYIYVYILKDSYKVHIVSWGLYNNPIYHPHFIDKVRFIEAK